MEEVYYWWGYDNGLWYLIFGATVCCSVIYLLMSFFYQTWEVLFVFLWTKLRNLWLASWQKLENQRGELLFCVLPDLDERPKIIWVFLDHGVHGDIPVAEPAVDDHVRDFLFLESVEQVIWFGILGKRGRFSTAWKEVKKFRFPTGDTGFFG